MSRILQLRRWNARKANTTAPVEEPKKKKVVKKTKKKKPVKE